MCNIAVVGAGQWGKNLIRNFKELGALYAAYDIETDYHTVIRNDEIQGIVIATPNDLHYSMTRDALLAGKDVFVEKPMTLNVKEAEELVKLAEDYNRILMTGHVMLYHPAIVKLKESIGSLGSIECLYYISIKPCRNGDAVWCLGPHGVSTALFLINDIKKAHIIVADTSSYREQKLVVIGSKATAVFDGTLTIGQEQIAFPSEEPLLIECRDFLDCIKTRKQPRANGANGLEVIRILWQFTKAAL